MKLKNKIILFLLISSIKSFSQTPLINNAAKKHAIEYFNLANNFKREEKFSSAIQNYEKAIEINNKYSFAYNNMGMCQEALGQNTAALRSYSNAILSDPNYFEAYNNRGLFKGKVLNDLDGAIGDFNKAILIKPDFSDGYMNRGVAYGIKGDYNKQIKDCSIAIQINNKFAEAYYNRAAAKYNLNLKSEACLDFEKSAMLGFKPAKSEYSKLCN